MTRQARRATIWLAFAITCSVSTLAQAQGPAPARTPGPKATYTENRTETGAAVVFDDDQALGTAFDPFADIVKAPPRAARMMLLRPRYNFVPEMLKSVENL